MQRRLAPKLEDELPIFLARAMFGGSNNLKIVVLVLALWVSINLLSASISDWFLQPFGWLPAARVLPLMLLLGLLWWLGRRRVRQISLTVVQSEDPQKCKALVLFLSPPRVDSGSVDAWSSDPAMKGGILNPEIRSGFKGPWRMPLEAIAHHLERLTDILVLPSSDAPGEQDGTYRHLDRFRTLVKWLACDDRRRIEVLGPAQFSAESSREWDLGADFEDADSLVRALGRMLEFLHLRKIEDYEIMIDITGGQKPPSVAGSAVALEKEGRRIQYVSTRDFKIRSYDITYRTEP